MEKDGREPFQNDLIKHGSEWFGSSTSCMNPRSSTVMCSPTVGAGGMALRGRCGEDGTCGEGSHGCMGGLGIGSGEEIQVTSLMMRGV